MSRLKEIRIEKGLTQKQLADDSGVPLRTIQDYEQKQMTIEKAKIYILASISKTLDCKFYEILEDEDLKDKLERRCKNDEAERD